MRRWLFLVPLVAFVALAAGFALPLMTGRDPGQLPSVLIDQPVPEFTLAALPGHDAGVASADFGQGRPMLLNVFASWCVPCLAEHPLLTRMAAEDGVTILGINYKDKPEDALAWLERNGDPFAAIGADRDGRVGIDLGVYGVPETFVIDGQGRVRFRYPGPLTPKLVSDTILPLLKALEG